MVVMEVKIQCELIEKCRRNGNLGVNETFFKRHWVLLPGSCQLEIRGLLPGSACEHLIRNELFVGPQGSVGEWYIGTYN